MLAQPGGLPHHVRHQHALAQRDGDRAHSDVPAQDGLDLAGFDPVPAELDLLVRPAVQPQRAVGGQARQVAGAVKPGSGRPERVGDEPLRGERGTAEVAAGHPGAAQVQLAHHARQHRPQQRVQHVRPRAAHRGTAGGGPPVGVHGRLGRPVQVARFDARRGDQPVPQGFRHGLAADDEHARPVPVRCQQAQVDQRGQVHRGQVEVVDPPVGHVVGERLRVAKGGLVDHVQLVPGDQPQQRIPGRVERERRRVRDPERGVRHRRPVRVPEVRQVRVGDHDALGGAGRPGCVDHVRGVGQARRLGLGRRLPRRVGVHDRRVPDVGQCGLAGGQHDVAAAVGEQELQAPHRVVQVERHRDAACLEDGEQAGDHLGARQRERHGPLPADTVRREHPGQPVGGRVEFGERGGAGQRARVGGAQGLGPEQLGQSQLAQLDGRFRRGAALGRRTQVHRGHRQVGVGCQVFQRGEQPGQDQLGCRPVQRGRAEVEHEDQLVAGQHGERERVVRGVVAAHPDDRPAVAGVGQVGRADRIVLEHDEGVEQIVHSGHLGEVGEPEVLVLQQRGLLALQPVEQVGRRLARIERDADRHRVDEQAHHRRRARQVGRPPGDGGAEHHVGPAGEGADQQAPRGLHDRVHRPAARRGHRAQERRTAPRARPRSAAPAARSPHRAPRSSVRPHRTARSARRPRPPGGRGWRATPGGPGTTARERAWPGHARGGVRPVRGRSDPATSRPPRGGGR